MKLFQLVEERKLENFEFFEKIDVWSLEEVLLALSVRVVALSRGSGSRKG